MIFNKEGRSGHITDHRPLDVVTAAAAATSFWTCGLVDVVAVNVGGGDDIVEFIFWTFYSSSYCRSRERIADRLLLFTRGYWLVIMFICINSKYINCVSFVPHHLVPAFGVWRKFPLRAD